MKKKINLKKYLTLRNLSFVGLLFTTLAIAENLDFIHSMYLAIGLGALYAYFSKFLEDILNEIKDLKK